MDAPVQSYLDKLILKRAAKPKPTVVLPANVEITDARKTVSVNRQLVMQRSAQYFSIVYNSRKTPHVEMNPKEAQYINPPRISDLAISKQPFDSAKEEVNKPEVNQSTSPNVSVPSSLADDSLEPIEYPDDDASNKVNEKATNEDDDKKEATLFEEVFGKSTPEPEEPKPEEPKPEGDKQEEPKPEGDKQEEPQSEEPQEKQEPQEKEIAEEELPEGELPQEELSKKKTREPRPRKIADTTVASGIDISGVEINETLITDRLPVPEKLVLKTSHYYMTNRKLYIQKLAELFGHYNTEIASGREAATCDAKPTESGSTQLLVHQRIVREYLNLYTPYRGLLLYHGLGSGKTASSIAIAEGMKSHKKIFILTPASLKMNFFSELKKYGDPLYKKHQFWEFVSTVGNPEYEDILSQVLSLPREYVLKNKGAWLVDVSKTDSNFNELDAAQQKSLDDQLNHMIRTKYIDINYNGLSADKLQRLISDHGSNPFDHSVVLIDEAHNLMSRIVNKLKKPNSLSMQLYKFFMNAQDARFVLMSGTPVINYPNEIAVLYNVLRGYIKTWTFSVKPPAGFTADRLPKLFDQENFRSYDFMDYSNGKLVITRNPFGFAYEKHPGPEKGSVRHVEKPKIRVVPGNNPPQAPDYLRNITSQSDSINHLNPPAANVVEAEKPQKSIFEMLGFTSTKEPAIVPNPEDVPNPEEVPPEVPKDVVPKDVVPKDVVPKDVVPKDVVPNPEEVPPEVPKDVVAEPLRRKITIKKLPKLGGKSPGKTRKTNRKTKCSIPKESTISVISIDIGLSSPDETQLQTNKNDYYEVRDGIIQLKYPIVHEYPLAEANKEIEHNLEMDYLTHYDGATDIHKGGTPDFHKGGMPDFHKGGMPDFHKGDAYNGGAPIVFDRYSGVHLSESGDINDDDFQQEIVRILKKNGFTVDINVSVVPHKCLPDSRDEFSKMFVDGETKTMRNVQLFKKRILGLTSYFRSAQETLLPSYVKNDKDGIYHLVPCEMSEYQLGKYDEIRETEREQEAKLANKRKKTQGQNPNPEEIPSTYRIFSRLACNFVFPPSLPRPLPMNASTIDEIISNETGEDITMEAVVDNRLTEMDDQPELPDDKTAPELSQTYAKQIAQAAIRLKTELTNNATTATGEIRDVEVLSRDGLAIYSPKMAAILDNLRDEENKGLHLLYSNFRTLEGIGILKLVLEKNGFAEFRVRKMGNGEWRIVDVDEDKSKPRFVLYTGTETAEEREVIRNVYNSNWDALPSGLSQSLRKQAENNYYGEIVRILMITASGAEGINLENTRFVHIVEPYWHLVRIEQVVGRARRICSHKNLPPELRTVKVFLYITSYSEAQRKSKKYLSLMTKDTSNKGAPITTDQYLYEMASIKDNLNGQILKSIKETAIDCNLYSKNHAAEGLVCYGFGEVKSNDFGTFPTMDEDQMQVDDINLQAKKFKPKKIDIPGQGVFVYNPETREAYDYTVYDNSRQFVLIGKITGDGNARRFEPTKK